MQYTWDGAWVTRNLGLSSVVLRIAGRNLVTWTKYTGIDPEMNLDGAIGLVQGLDWFNNPQSRALVFSIASQSMRPRRMSTVVRCRDSALRAARSLLALAGCSDFLSGPGVSTNPNVPTTATTDQLWVGSRSG